MCKLKFWYLCWSEESKLTLGRADQEAFWFFFFLGDFGSKLGLERFIVFTMMKEEKILLAKSQIENNIGHV